MYCEIPDQCISVTLTFFSLSPTILSLLLLLPQSTKVLWTHNQIRLQTTPIHEGSARAITRRRYLSALYRVARAHASVFTFIHVHQARSSNLTRTHVQNVDTRTHTAKVEEVVCSYRLKLARKSGGS